MSSLLFFLPSPDLISLLRSIMLNDFNVDLHSLPQCVGHFVPTDSFTVSSVSI